MLERSGQLSGAMIAGPRGGFVSEWKLMVSTLPVVLALLGLKLFLERVVGFEGLIDFSERRHHPDLGRVPDRVPAGRHDFRPQVKRKSCRLPG